MKSLEEKTSKAKKEVLLSVGPEHPEDPVQGFLKVQDYSVDGKDPENFDEKDLLLAETYDRLASDEDPEKV